MLVAENAPGHAPSQSAHTVLIPPHDSLRFITQLIPDQIYFACWEKAATPLFCYKKARKGYNVRLLLEVSPS